MVSFHQKISGPYSTVNNRAKYEIKATIYQKRARKSLEEVIGVPSEMLISFGKPADFPSELKLPFGWAGGFLFLLMPKGQSASLGRFKMVYCDIVVFPKFPQKC
jgi:hypothetical protein